jgi:hypothetical protein
VYETWVAVSDCKHNVGHLAVAQYSSGGKLGVVKERSWGAHARPPSSTQNKEVVQEGKRWWLRPGHRMFSTRDPAKRLVRA